MMIAISLLKAFLFTLICEFATAFLMGYRGKQFFLGLAAVNLMTNPLINYILMVLRTLGYVRIYPFAEIFLEITVILAEWKALRYAFGNCKKSLLKLSIVMNIVSYAIGLIIYWRYA